MSMNKTLNIFIAFIAMLVLAFYAVGFTATVQAPSNTTLAGQQYENLTNTIEIADTGTNATLILIIIGMVFSAIIVFMGFNMGKRRR